MTKNKSLKQTTPEIEQGRLNRIMAFAADYKNKIDNRFVEGMKCPTCGYDKMRVIDKKFEPISNQQFTFLIRVLCICNRKSVIQLVETFNEKGLVVIRK